MGIQRSIAQDQRLIHKIAHKAHRWLLAAGVRGVEFEDVVQEISMTWVMACERFNPELGLQFSTYFYTAAWRNITRTIQGEAGECQATNVSLDATRGEDGDMTIQVAADEEDADVLIERKQRQREVMRRLSPKARMAVQIVRDPPKELMAEFEQLRERMRYGRARGIAAAVPRDLNLGVVMHFLGYSSVERTRIRKELDGLASKVAA
ncbi:sigma factor [Inquilinus sp. OTU3971]|uniref:sigma factor n=1 Tax=Inquilinus sp. OTU3971 TaxID=3043855 RepID=UPI00313B7945